MYCRVYCRSPHSFHYRSVHRMISCSRRCMVVRSLVSVAIRWRQQAWKNNPRSLGVLVVRQQQQLRSTTTTTTTTTSTSAHNNEDPSSSMSSISSAATVGNWKDLLKHLASRYLETRAAMHQQQEPPQRMQQRQQALANELAQALLQLYPSLPSLTLLDTITTTKSSSCERIQVLEYVAVGLAYAPFGDAAAAAAVAAAASVMDRGSSSSRDGGWRRSSTFTRPFYETILEALWQEPGGLDVLLAMRRDLLQYLALVSNNNKQAMQQLDQSLLTLLKLVCGKALLQLERITYEHTSAWVLERLAKKEAVHPVQSLHDLRQRLGHHRRVYALFHPLLINQPLMVLYTSLQLEIPSSMKQIHEEPITTTTTTTVESPRGVATFYSISNLEPALMGVGLGEHLIHQATSVLQHELQIQTFVTLSPLPRFRKWLEERARASKEDSKFASDWSEWIPHKEDRVQALAAFLECHPDQALIRLVTKLVKEPPNLLLPDEDEDSSIVSQVLVDLAAHYLIKEKHRRKPLDSVARFHISNGAEVYRINLGADLSRKGIQTSFGVMVNYLYPLDRLASNRARFEMDYHVPSNDLIPAFYREK